ncbi:MAG: helix-turn-helix domain-containing protein [Chitinophaga sp.]|uniref:AraC family transcriptional regulator n=1 Tax=Chitinophaga sp. TaxID=1869181 RepID=UPI001B1BB560|nr:AraC family transcriptional regulator [Chitinophaga sp.]MBO9732415.1 helix-turn-helix domain-containing protein [Chitinophaga sp.]
MKYLYEKFTSPADQSLTIRTEILEMKETDIFKCHANFKIVLLENCIGKRFIGDHIDDFEGPELVLLGRYLPHYWQYSGVHDSNLLPMASVVHFSPDFLGKELLEKPEAKELSDLLCAAARGIVFTGDTIGHARFILQQMLREKGFGRMAWMAQLLNVLMRSGNHKVLSSPYFNLEETSVDGQKINKVFDYIYKNFRNEITLREVAAIVPMSSNAFCRFFKQKTNKTLSDTIKEVRITHAAKLILAGMYNVSEACYNSGYNNLSNFNKHFKELKGLSPRNFIKKYKGPGLKVEASNNVMQY